MCRHEEVYFIRSDCTVWEIERVDGQSLHYDLMSWRRHKIFVNIHVRGLKCTVTGNAYNNLCDFVSFALL